MTELAEVQINGEPLETIAVESPDRSAVAEASRALGIDDLENVNYVRAIKSVIGMTPGSLAPPR